MNQVLATIIDKTSPKFNKNITNGSTKEILRIVPDYLDSIFKSSIKSISPNVPLKYVGHRRMTPEEEYSKIIANDNNKITYDIALSDLYVEEFVFDYNGEKISRPLYLPYTDKGNLIHISNTMYNIVPVLSDTVISPSHKEVFVRLLKDKLTFKRKISNFILNGETVKGQVIYTVTIKTTTMQLSDNMGKQFTSISLYLLCEYGLKEVMNHYVPGCDYIVTDENVDNLRDKYDVYESSNIKPRNLKVDGYYKGHSVKFLIKKDLKIENKTFLENFIYGLLYTFDVLPDHADDFLDVYRNNNVNDEKLHWRIILGRIAYRNSYSIDRIVEDMNEHFITLQGYLDNLIKGKLEDNGMYVDNFFDLLVVIMQNYNDWLLSSKEYNSNITNRYIDILYYVLYDIIIGFNKVVLNVNKRASKKQGLLSLKEVSKIISNEFKTRTIYTLTKSSSMNICMQLTDTTSDIIYPKVTAMLEDQSRGCGVRRGSQTTFPEHTKTLKGHDLYFGSLLFLNKSAPSPRFRANLYMNYNIYTGRLIIPEDINKTIDLLNIMLIGRLENENVEVLEKEGDEEMKDL